MLNEMIRNGSVVLGLFCYEKVYWFGARLQLTETSSKPWHHHCIRLLIL